ncbi:hypothetical protein JOE40_000252 [Arthrobacter sp. PvP102]|uniref:hypothetical protein n=1 Tax=unclassified Arthrobacter TaxID=235627 RepID=UPI001AE9C6C7|nr:MULTISPECIES: hypothetical protein [unclassified Arthrobacter]MBP1234785.1 hypothetical protein [Arthrobacter sp. PvP103]MBP1235743.1 hypothetical protein [Arthrobacter sp. PvP102]
MDGNQGPQGEPAMAGRDEYDLQSLKAMLDCLLQEFTLPPDIPGLIEYNRRLDELTSAVSSVRTRLEVAAVLSHAPTATSGVGTTPMASRAADRLRHAVIRLMAAGARTINVTAQRDT